MSQPAPSAPPPAPPHEPEPVDLSQESVAGEEDPGASLEVPPDKRREGGDQNVPG